MAKGSREPPDERRTFARPWLFAVGISRMSPFDRQGQLHGMNGLFAKDLASSALFRAPGAAIGNLAGFIAVNRLGAADAWAGLVWSANCLGFMLNVVFGRVTARISVERSIVLIIVVCSVLVATAVLGAWGLHVTLGISLVLAVICTTSVWLPGIDGSSPATLT